MPSDLTPRLILPSALLELGTVAKMLWLYFNLTGPVVASQRELSVTTCRQ
jgi:hypothetical protein